MAVVLNTTTDTSAYYFDFFWIHLQPIHSKKEINNGFLITKGRCIDINNNIASSRMDFVPHLYQTEIHPMLGIVSCVPSMVLIFAPKSPGLYQMC